MPGGCGGMHAPMSGPCGGMHQQHQQQPGPLPGMGGHGGGYGQHQPVAGSGVLPPNQIAGMSPSSNTGMGMAPSKSTAPTASAAPVVDDLPVCWPLPTKTQQKLSTTQTTASANQAIQNRSAGGGVAIGEPMDPNDLSQVKLVFSMLLDASAQDGNMKKREDISKRLEELYAQLQMGQMRTAASQKVIHLVRCIEAQDYAGANKTQTELCTIDWELNKNWLMGIKRLIPRG